MLFYMQMRWNIEGRISFEEVWNLEIEESKAAQAGFKVVGMYKVAGQRRVIVLVDVPRRMNWIARLWASFPCGSFWNLRPSGRYDLSRILSGIAVRILVQRR